MEIIILQSIFFVADLDNSTSKADPTNSQEPEQWRGYSVALHVFLPLAGFCILWGRRDLLTRLLLQIDRSCIAVFCPSLSKREKLLKWASENLPATWSSPSKTLSGGIPELWKDGSLLCTLINMAIPGACSNPPKHWKKPPMHAQALAFKYLGVVPVFTEDEFEETLSPTQEQKFLLYLQELQYAIKKYGPEDSALQFSPDYLVKGMGLQTGEQHRKTTFYIYSNTTSSNCNNILVYIRGPYGTQGTATVPAFHNLNSVSVLNYLHKQFRASDKIVYKKETRKSFLKSIALDFTSFVNLDKKLVTNDVPIHVEMENDRARITYIPNNFGIYEINLITNGEILSGSPFIPNITENSSGLQDTFESTEKILKELPAVRKKRIISRFIDCIDEKIELNGKDDKLLKKTMVERIASVSLVSDEKDQEKPSVFDENLTQALPHAVIQFEVQQNVEEIAQCESLGVLESINEDQDENSDSNEISVSPDNGTTENIQSVKPFRDKKYIPIVKIITPEEKNLNADVISTNVINEASNVTEENISTLLKSDGCKNLDAQYGQSNITRAIRMFESQSASRRSRKEEKEGVLALEDSTSSGTHKVYSPEYADVCITESQISPKVHISETHIEQNEDSTENRESFSNSKYASSSAVNQVLSTENLTPSKSESSLNTIDSNYILQKSKMGLSNVKPAEQKPNKPTSKVLPFAKVVSSTTVQPDLSKLPENSNPQRYSGLPLNFNKKHSESSCHLIEESQIRSSPISKNLLVSGNSENNSDNISLKERSVESNPVEYQSKDIFKSNSIEDLKNILMNKLNEIHLKSNNTKEMKNLVNRTNKLKILNNVQQIADENNNKSVDSVLTSPICPDHIAPEVEPLEDNSFGNLPLSKKRNFFAKNSCVSLPSLNYSSISNRKIEDVAEKTGESKYSLQVLTVIDMIKTNGTSNKLSKTTSKSVPNISSNNSLGSESSQNNDDLRKSFFRTKEYWKSLENFSSSVTSDLSGKRTEKLKLLKNSSSFYRNMHRSADDILSISKTNLETQEIHKYSSLTQNDFKSIDFVTIEERKKKLLREEYKKESRSTVHKQKPVSRECKNEKLVIQNAEASVKSDVAADNSTKDVQAKPPEVIYQKDQCEEKKTVSQFKRAFKFFKNLEKTSTSEGKRSLKDKRLHHSDIRRRFSLDFHKQKGCKQKIGGSLRLPKTSEKFSITQLYTDIIGNRRGSFRGSPNREALTESLASLSTKTDSKNRESDFENCINYSMFLNKLKSKKRKSVRSIFDIHY